MRKESNYCLPYATNITQTMVLAFFMLLQTSCDHFYSKDNYLRDFEKFVTEIEENASAFTPTDWNEIHLQFDQLNTELYQRIHSELTSEDQQKIGHLKARYAKVMLKHNLNEMLDNVEDGVEQLKGAMEEQ